MSFKNNIDDMFKKVFPQAAEAAESDHGGFNIGDLIVIILDLTLLIYTGYRSWHFLSGSVSDSFQILAIVGLIGLDVGAVAWSLVWMFGSTTRFQNWTSMALFIIDLMGVMLTSLVDSMSYGQAAAAIPPILKTVAWFGIPIIIFGNVLAGFIYHMTSPNTRRMRAERSQDEDLAKQRERGNLELRRMNMMLKQAQDYTTERAKFLTAFAEVAEQNIAMADIEAQMMARLNKAAGGQLGSLMSGAGMTLSDRLFDESQQPRALDGVKENLWNKVNGLKTKYIDGTPTNASQFPARLNSADEVSTRFRPAQPSGSTHGQDVTQLPGYVGNEHFIPRLDDEQLATEHGRREIEFWDGDYWYKGHPAYNLPARLFRQPAGSKSLYWTELDDRALIPGHMQAIGMPIERKKDFRNPNPYFVAADGYQYEYAKPFNIPEMLWKSRHGSSGVLTDARDEISKLHHYLADSQPSELDAQIAAEIAATYPSIAIYAPKIVAAMHALIPNVFRLAQQGNEDQLAYIQVALLNQGLPDLTKFLEPEDWERLAGWCERLHSAEPVPAAQASFRPTGFGKNGRDRGDVGPRPLLGNF